MMGTTIPPEEDIDECQTCGYQPLGPADVAAHVHCPECGALPDDAHGDHAAREMTTETTTNLREISTTSERHLLAPDQLAELRETDGRSTTRAWAFNYQPGGQRGSALLFCDDGRLAVAMGGDSVWLNFGGDPDDAAAIVAAIEESTHDSEALPICPACSYRMTTDGTFCDRCGWTVDADPLRHIAR